MSTRAVRCFLAVHAGQAVAFAAILPCPGLRSAYRVSRVVVLPDWQGVGVGRAFLAALGELYTQHGRRLYLRTSHAAMIRSLGGDPRWRCAGQYRRGSSPAHGMRSVDKAARPHQVSRRPGVSFVFAGIAELLEGEPAPKRESAR